MHVRGATVCRVQTLVLSDGRSDIGLLHPSDTAAAPLARSVARALEDGGADVTRATFPSNGDPADGRVTGTVAAWVRALGPEGSTDGLDISGQRALAEAVLDGFARAGTRRSAAAA